MKQSVSVGHGLSVLVHPGVSASTEPLEVAGELVARTVGDEIAEHSPGQPG